MLSLTLFLRGKVCVALLTRSHAIGKYTVFSDVWSKVSEGSSGESPSFDPCSNLVPGSMGPSRAIVALLMLQSHAMLGYCVLLARMKDGGVVLVRCCIGESPYPLSGHMLWFTTRIVGGSCLIYIEWHPHHRYYITITHLV